MKNSGENYKKLVQTFNPPESFSAIVSGDRAKGYQFLETIDNFGIITESLYHSLP
jgi:hypothetical protein